MAHNCLPPRQRPTIISIDKNDVWQNANRIAITTPGQKRHADATSHMAIAAHALVPPQNGHVTPVVAKKPQSGTSLATTSDETPSPMGQATTRLDRHAISAIVSRSVFALLDSAVIGNLFCEYKLADDADRHRDEHPHAAEEKPNKSDEPENEHVED